MFILDANCHFNGGSVFLRSSRSKLDINSCGSPSSILLSFRLSTSSSSSSSQFMITVVLDSCRVDSKIAFSMSSNCIRDSATAIVSHYSKYERNRYTMRFGKNVNGINLARIFREIGFLLLFFLVSFRFVHSTLYTSPEVCVRPDYRATELSHRL